MEERKKQQREDFVWAHLSSVVTSDSSIVYLEPAFRDYKTPVALQDASHRASCTMMTWSECRRPGGHPSLFADAKSPCLKRTEATIYLYPKVGGYPLADQTLTYCHSTDAIKILLQLAWYGSFRSLQARPSLLKKRKGWTTYHC